MASKLDSEKRQEIMDALQRGNKIQAIKLYRNFTDSSLKESKDFIENLWAQLREQDPETYAANSVGCGGAAALFVILTSGLIATLLS